MNTKYNQIKAMLAITKASLRAVLRSPSAIVFSIGFPLIFIVVFGLAGGSSRMYFSVAFTKDSDTANLPYQILKTGVGLKIEEYANDKLVKEDLEKGNLTALINVKANADTNLSKYTIKLTSSEAVNQQNLQLLKMVINSITAKLNQQKPSNQMVSVDEATITVPGREYRNIDFILPGQLGFSLLSAGVFGVAFIFFNLRQQLVLKRFYATPIKRSYIVLGEALARVIFQIITAVIIIGVGHYVFHFTLVNGIFTFFNILLLSFVALMLFMGFGFIVSSFAKNESSIPPFANLFTLPQFLLAGTFFPIEAFPSWLQPICKILPLTHFNNAMRAISFEGATFFSCWKEVGVLGIWIVIVYAVAIKYFKWE